MADTLASCRTSTTEAETTDASSTAWVPVGGRQQVEAGGNLGAFRERTVGG